MAGATAADRALPANGQMALVAATALTAPMLIV